MAEGWEKIVGRVWKFGDHLSTDHILPTRFMAQVEPHELAANCMAGIDPDFAARVSPSDILAAGENIGYGSSREQAPRALKCAGFRAVVAVSFARIFYRNGYNIGLPAIVCPEFVADLAEGDRAEIRLTAGTLRNLRTDRCYSFPKPPEFLIGFIREGGLIPYLEKTLPPS